MSTTSKIAKKKRNSKKDSKRTVCYKIAKSKAKTQQKNENDCHTSWYKHIYCDQYEIGSIVYELFTLKETINPSCISYPHLKINHKPNEVKMLTVLPTCIFLRVRMEGQSSNTNS